jgi:VCBS repeat-containing protein
VPVISGTDTGTVTEDADPVGDGWLETSGALTITDADAGEDQFVAAAIEGNYGTLTIEASGSWTYTAANVQQAIQVLNAGESLTDTLTVITADGSHHSVVVTINGTNDAVIVISNQTSQDPDTADDEMIQEGSSGNSSLFEKDGQDSTQISDASPAPADDSDRKESVTTTGGASSSKQAPEKNAAVEDATEDQSQEEVEEEGAEKASSKDNVKRDDEDSKKDKTQKERSDSEDSRAPSDKDMHFDRAKDSDEMGLTVAMDSQSSDRRVSERVYQQLRDSLDGLKNEADKENRMEKAVVGSAIAASTGLSVGYVVWLLRSGMLLSSLLSSMPAWQLADPLPILSGRRDDDEGEEEDSLESIIKNKSQNDDNRRSKPNFAKSDPGHQG